jgi:hypothetical protein
MSDNKGGMWKYVVMACFKALPQHLPEVTEKNYEKPQ